MATLIELYEEEQRLYKRQLARKATYAEAEKAKKAEIRKLQDEIAEKISEEREKQNER
ncbi:hypothetical protein [Bacillus toyonensis]|uniref:hypothetical protein n=1 Tax=Bacillus toyonensis TaxID=155322 RepID=UPI0018A1508C|nr:hypothetical protein [Bacillus toyonensis]MBF7146774.1 hypothetical protein [Bacillus toyonensis]MEC2351220.1 hypothetical protein [Bacillus toyonensis]MED3185644.1 hypothetical protein [Bacillus toyonensis]